MRAWRPRRRRLETVPSVLAEAVGFLVLFGAWQAVAAWLVSR